MGQYRHAVFSLTSTAMVVIAASARLVCLHRAGPPPWAWSCSSAGSDRRAEIRPPRVPQSRTTAPCPVCVAQWMKSFSTAN